MVDYAIVETKSINEATSDNVVNLTLHTIELKKQVLVFNNSKRGSESTAEKISKAIKKVENQEELLQLSKKILKALSVPTKQCKRLAQIVEKGVAFHHSGLVSKQREIIEKAFKDGFIKVISSTPTLAAGLNLPAYKVIVKDYKRYSQRGYNDIPILEYHQMSGRAGRPGKEDVGMAVLCVGSDYEKDRVIPKYVFGDPEEIVSKLAVEPTLKMYMLSLIAMDMINTKKEIQEFFANTLYAKQYKDVNELNRNVFRIVDILKEYTFIEQDDDYYVATRLGKKISELYLNPDTAHYLLENIDELFARFSKPEITNMDEYSLIHLLTNTMEMRPLFSVKKPEEEQYIEKLEKLSDLLIAKFNPFEEDYETYLNTLKTTDLFTDWIKEAPEDYIMDKYKVTPGELNYKIEIIDWILYSLEELSLLKKNFFFKNYLNKLRIRFKNGIKQELLPLITLKGVGRVRARKLYTSGLKNLRDLHLADFAQLSRIVGDGLTIKIKEQLKQDISINQSTLDDKPKEIKIRDVTEQEIEQLVTTYKQFEKEKEESNRSLNEFF